MQSPKNGRRMMPVDCSLVTLIWRNDQAILDLQTYAMEDERIFPLEIDFFFGFIQLYDSNIELLAKTAN